MRVSFLVALFLAAACSKPSPCEEACALVARCKKEARDGERMLGEKKPRPDKACLRKCADKPDEFAECEGRQKTCKGLSRCMPSLRR